MIVSAFLCLAAVMPAGAEAGLGRTVEFEFYSQAAWALTDLILSQAAMVWSRFTK